MELPDTYFKIKMTGKLYFNNQERCEKDENDKSRKK